MIRDELSTPIAPRAKGDVVNFVTDFEFNPRSLQSESTIIIIIIIIIRTFIKRRSMRYATVALVQLIESSIE